ncbi:MAG TPA: bifunctional oligoribonuclease/PAP phosphatase NrnA [Limnochordia bacterium]|nr:bifunctional oligoribonuclease/PAP phosphatase NrnA [Limnochordia bacterium]
MAERGAPAQVLAALRPHQRFLIACHVDPDPDAVGSILAVHWLLAKLGKTSVPASPDAPPHWPTLPGFAHIATPEAAEAAGPYDALVVVDCEPSRTGRLAAWAERLPVINIDHHVTNPGTVGTAWISPAAAATGEMLFHLIDAAGVGVDADVATLLYAAIMGDTGSFRYSNSTPAVFDVASKLVAAGAKPDRIADQILDTRPRTYLRLLALVLQTFAESEDGRITWLTVTPDLIARSGASPDDASGMVHFARALSGVEVAMLYRQTGEREVKVSFRARGEIDVSAIAKSFGGGGHPKAAGCTIEASLDEAHARVLARVRAALGGG